MPIGYNGKEYYNVYLNGNYYLTGIFNGKRVLSVFDPNFYLMASNKVFLGATTDIRLSYRNDIYPTIDELSNKEIGENPFEVSLDINKKEISSGTKYIIDCPGLIKIKAQDEKIFVMLECAEDFNWKYLPTDETVDSWNHLSLIGTGKILKLLLNDNEHIILDSSNTKSYTLYQGKRYANLLLSDTAPLNSAESWEFQTKINWKGGASYPCVIGYSGGSDYKTPCLVYQGGAVIMFLSSTGYTWDMNTSPSSFVPVAGKTYDIRAGFTGSRYYLDYKENGSQEWINAWEMDSTTKVFCNVPFWLMNLSLNDYNYYNEGIIYIDFTKIIINGNIWFDGSGKEGSVTYTNNNCIESIVYDGPLYPNIECGQIKTYNNYSLARNIQAKFLGE